MGSRPLIRTVGSIALALFGGLACGLTFVGAENEVDGSDASDARSEPPVDANRPDLGIEKDAADVDAVDAPPINACSSPRILLGGTAACACPATEIKGEKARVYCNDNGRNECLNSSIECNTTWRTCVRCFANSKEKWFGTATPLEFDQSLACPPRPPDEECPCNSVGDCPVPGMVCVAQGSGGTKACRLCGEQGSLGQDCSGAGGKVCSLEASGYLCVSN